MRWMILALTVVSAACGEDAPIQMVAPTPVPPSPTVPQLAGRWSGRMETFYTITNSRVGVNVNVFFTQNSRDIGGNWAITSEGNEAAGVITGSVSGFAPGGEFTGTFTWESGADDGSNGARRCQGVANVTGNVGSTVRLSARTISFNGTCADVFSDVTWTLTPALGAGIATF